MAALNFLGINIVPYKLKECALFLGLMSSEAKLRGPLRNLVPLAQKPTFG